MIKLAAKIGLGFFLVAIVAPLLVRAATFQWDGVPWHQASRAKTGLAPDPGSESGAVIQVYAARTYGWRGAVAVHTWIVTKEAGAARYRRFDVIGWGGGRKVRVNYAAPDAMWYGAEPQLLADLRGPEAAVLIPRIHDAVDRYPWADEYGTFPGPNSNTFTAYVAREVPELGLNLPPTAIGKDYRPASRILGRPPSGRGLQLSVFGLGGVILSPIEGVEINLLGLSAGIDGSLLALRLPGWGRVGWTSEAMASE